MKYKIVGEPIVQTGQYGEYKIADLVGPAGETYSRVFFGSRGSGYKFVVPTGEVEGEIDSSGRGPKFVFPRSGGFKKSDRDYAGEEERRSERIAYLASMERAVEVMDMLLKNKNTHPTKDQVRASLCEWRDWFINEYKTNTK